METCVHESFSERVAFYTYQLFFFFIRARVMPVSPGKMFVFKNQLDSIIINFE